MVAIETSTTPKKGDVIKIKNVLNKLEEWELTTEGIVTDMNHSPMLFTAKKVGDRMFEILRDDVYFYVSKEKIDGTELLETGAQKIIREMGGNWKATSPQAKKVAQWCYENMQLKLNKE